MYVVSALITHGQITSSCYNTSGRGPEEKDNHKFSSKGKRIRSSLKICRERSCIFIKSRTIHMDTCPSQRLLLLLATIVPEWSAVNINRTVVHGHLSAPSLLFPNATKHKWLWNFLEKRLTSRSSTKIKSLFLAYVSFVSTF